MQFVGGTIDRRLTLLPRGGGEITEPRQCRWCGGLRRAGREGRGGVVFQSQLDQFGRGAIGQHRGQQQRKIDPGRDAAAGDAIAIDAHPRLGGDRAKRAETIHWGRTRDFRNRYPSVKLEPDSIFVRDGAIWSSAGISAGIDLALAIIAEDFGDAIAQQTARQLVVYHRRSGGQSQFSSLLELQSPAGRFGALLDWVRAHLHQRLTVEELAARVAMSPRHFARAFITETGTTPAKAVERLRIEAARSMVQSSASSIERVAQATGFGDPERMRRAFIRAFGQPPQALRRAYRATAHH